MSFTLTPENLGDLAEGAAVLGTGGGGDPYIGRLLVERQLRAGREVRIVDLDTLRNDALVVAVAMMGAPTVFIEKLPSPEGSVAALRALERHLGRAVDAIMPLEAGGLNSMMPLVAAAAADLPVVDADGMGRAFPEIQMVTFNVAGVPGSPMGIASDHGDSAVIEAADNDRMEWLARGLTIRMGGAAYTASYPMSAATVRETAVPGTLGLALKIGTALRTARERHRDPFDALTDALRGTFYSHGRVLFRGKVVDVDRTTVGGFARGQVTLAASGDPGDPGDRIVITFQNEHLVAVRAGEHGHDGQVAAIVPDLICTLNTETGRPVTTEALAYGQRLTVYAISTPAIMRSPEALACFGPSAFGLDRPYTPLEELTPATP
ncbi:DUF917 domain-containing protein [Streptosporangium sp. NPDC050855]|uniref:DUF917 domain-containing protein n=1 Tax=Streptosporangium sp. NPDC050855 TaxID=3366194 RepID=UPI0037A401BB